MKKSLFSEVFLATRRLWLRRRSTEDVFTNIYVRNIWGGERGSFCSGPGSTSEHVVVPYVQKMRELLREIGAERMRVVDLGCGDFRVGSQLVDLCGHYLGIDVVKTLVERNAASFGSKRVEFQHLDITKDKLPGGDICFVRQVLQHLSNRQIATILSKLGQYQLAVISEHQPKARQLSLPNMDKIPGGDIRLERGSGVFLEAPPFSIPKERLKVLLEVEVSLVSEEGVIRTYAMTPDSHPIR